MLGVATAEQVRGAFDALSGEIHASLKGVLLDDSLYVRNAVLGRLRSASYAGATGEMAALGHAGPALAYAAQEAAGVSGEMPIETRPPEPELTFWAQGFGAWGWSTATATRPRLNARSRRLHHRLRHAASAIGRGASPRATRMSNVRGGRRAASRRKSIPPISPAYVGARFGAWSLRGGAAYAWHARYHPLDRVPRLLRRSDARYDGDTAQAFGEIGYGIGARPRRARAVRGPRLRAREHATASPRPAAPRRSRAPAKSQERRLFLARPAAATQHSAGERHGADAARIRRLAACLRRGHAERRARVPAPAAAFTVAGVPIARDSALIEAGFDLAVSATRGSASAMSVGSRARPRTTV